MVYRTFHSLKNKSRKLILSVPIKVKIIGIGLLPVIIMGLSINYWVTTGLSDWLSHLLDDTRVQAAMLAGSRSVIFVTVLFALLSIFLAYWFTYMLTRPILELKKTAEEVAKGNYHSRLEVWASDEIGSLAISINRMIDNFVAYQEELLEINQQLEVTNAISRAADERESIHDVLYLILKEVQNYLDFEYGWVYLFDPEINQHHLATWCGVPENLKSHLLHQKNDLHCNCLTNFKSENQETINYLNCDRLMSSGKKHLRHASIPLVYDEVYYGVINLVMPHYLELDMEKSKFIDSMAAQASKIVANAWYKIKLREKEAARQILLESLVTAQEDERLRLARELHDQTGQTLTNLLIRMQTIERKAENPTIQTDLKRAQSYVSEAIEKVRDISYSLRPPVLEEFGVGAAIKDLTANITRETDIETSCRCNLQQNLSSEIEVMIYRIVQEGLTNIVRHSNATRADVDLEVDHNTLQLTINDNGKGFDPAEVTIDDEKKRLGLLSMNERADLIGGDFDIRSTPGEGTTIRVSIPIT